MGLKVTVKSDRRAGDMHTAVSCLWELHPCCGIFKKGLGGERWGAGRSWTCLCLGGGGEAHGPPGKYTSRTTYLHVRYHLFPAHPSHPPHPAGSLLSVAHVTTALPSVSVRTRWGNPPASHSQSAPSDVGHWNSKHRWANRVKPKKIALWAHVSQISLLAFNQSTRLEQAPEQTKAENPPLSKAGF